MKKIFTKYKLSLVISLVTLGAIGLTSCTAFDAPTTDVSNGLDDYVNTKYSNGMADSAASQANWKMANCHDPKIFQDDDGTYYVYATDASTGNIGYTGLNVRYSKDLVNWTVSSKSSFQGYWDKEFLAWEGFAASSSEQVQNNTSYTASSWAPTVIKQNGLYYMYHGVNADVTALGGKAASSIVLAIASKPLGPFYPASFISAYTSGSDTKGNDADILSIKNKLADLGVSYTNNFLVRYCRPSTANAQGSYDGTTVTCTNDYATCGNAIYGCIDPEFVFDLADGSLKEFTIGSNSCYALTYGSWLYGIVLCYVDKVSLKPVAQAAFSTYSTGDELNIPLDYAAQLTSDTDLLGTPLIGGAANATTPSNAASTAYEGAQVFYNSNTSYYYIITSCGNLNWEYRCGLGRASSITGPYLDAGGKDMWLGTTDYAKYHAIGSKIIGSQVLNNEYSFRSQGGLSVIRANNGKILFVCHSRTNFQKEYYFYLQLHQMFFNEEYWPVLNQNEYYSDYSGYTSSGSESLSKLSLSDIAGTYNTILTVRGTETGTFTSGAGETATKVCLADAEPTESKTMVIEADGTISGTNYSGSVALEADGYTATILLKDSTGSDLGTFKGYFMYAVDWAKKGSRTDRYTITFTTLDSSTTDSEAGEYFWGNRK